MHTLQSINVANVFVKSRTNHTPELRIILGSGLGSLAEEMKDADVIPYEDIPHFSKSDAEGHANELVIGELEGKKIVAMKGRYHYYEGHSLYEVTVRVSVIQDIRIESIII